MAEDRNAEYDRELRSLQIELVKLQRKLISDGARLLIILEGRDAAGKDGTIKRLTEHMSPRETRVFAPSKPTDGEARAWYFQRFVTQLPTGQEIVIFNRSWYNRAGVERVMGFCTEDEVENFFETVNNFEALLVRSGIAIRKYYLDISRHVQKERLKDRETDPLMTWKNSPVDARAVKLWHKYTEARDDMFRRTSHLHAPWRVVRADHKKQARLGLMRDLLDSFSYPRKKAKLVKPDRDIVFPWSLSAEKDGLLAH